MSFLGLFGNRPSVAATVAAAQSSYDSAVNTVANTVMPSESFSSKMISELDALTVLARSHSGIIPTESYSRVRQVDDVFRPLLAYIDSNGCSPEQEHLLESMVTDYIPNAINTYISLSPMDRNEKTSKMLNSQFDTMLEKVYDLAHLVRQGALDELAIQTDFIDARFR